MKKLCLVLALLSVVFSLSACGGERMYFRSAPDDACWRIGFASVQIELPETEEPLYIAGYRNGVEITGVLDLQCANAVWIDNGGSGILLIGVDCVGLSSATVNRIRVRLKSFLQETDCTAVNIYATHTHAGVDTLGLWGPPAVDGKNAAFMDNLVSACVNSAEDAWADRRTGTLRYGSTVTSGLLRDSREPQVYDPALRQLRFVPDDGTAGVRMLFFSAHAESMRGENTLLSRDYPGAAADYILKETGDRTLFLPGAVGGLIMTEVLTTGTFDPAENCRLTGEAVARAALSVRPEEEIAVAPDNLIYARESVTIPLDNTLFLYYKFLGILGNDAVNGRGATGYSLRSSVSVIRLGIGADTLTLALLPCEIFPELVTGETLTADDPQPLVSLCSGELLVVGLCNDELGYVVPSSAYRVDDELPYFITSEDESGENHYEETNSVGPLAAQRIADAFASIIRRIDKQ